jgi:hypothetical protein
MKIELELDCELTDKIVEATLLETYKDLQKDIKEKNWGEVNLEQFAEVVKGLELVGPWYVHNWDKKKKAKK